MGDQVAQRTNIMPRLESPQEQLIVCTTEVEFLVEYYTSNDDEDVMPCLQVFQAKEDPKPKPDEIQVIELEVERPYPVLTPCISYIF